MSGSRYNIIMCNHDTLRIIVIFDLRGNKFSSHMASYAEVLWFDHCYLLSKVDKVVSDHNALALGRTQYDMFDRDIWL